MYTFTYIYMCLYFQSAIATADQLRLTAHGCPTQLACVSPCPFPKPRPGKGPVWRCDLQSCEQTLSCQELGQELKMSIPV